VPSDKQISEVNVSTLNVILDMLFHVRSRYYRTCTTCLPTLGMVCWVDRSHIEHSSAFVRSSLLLALALLSRDLSLGP
jgi:hypothetical protein